MTSNEAVVLVIECLETSGVPYMIVGSFASNIYGVSRAMKDADIVLELSSHSLGSILKGKDRDDIRDVIVVQGDAIDWNYVHRWCDDHGTLALLDEIRASIPAGI